jgi:hypothetical protein
MCCGSGLDQEEEERERKESAFQLVDHPKPLW